MNERERMTCENNKKCPLHILSLEDSRMDAELIYEFLCENFGSEIQMDIVMKEEEFVSEISSIWNWMKWTSKLTNTWKRLSIRDGINLKAGIVKAMEHSSTHIIASLLY